MKEHMDFNHEGAASCSGIKAGFKKRTSTSNKLRKTTILETTYSGE